MIRVAFASSDRVRVDQHFGAAEGFVLYDVGPDNAALAAVAEFPEEAMDGNENKLIAKVDFLSGCAAVYVLAIGASAIKQLMAKGIQPIRVNDEQSAIADLIRELSQAIKGGGVPWIERALAQQKSPSRFDQMEEEGWAE